jgi:protein gp37
MADQRDGGITWTDQTWNPIRGCTRVSEGCRNCYAERVAARFSGPGQPYSGLATQDPPRWTGKVAMAVDHLEDPLHWKRPRRIFVNSMSDLFHPALHYELIDQVVAVMALAGHHQFQVLTKRPHRMADYLARTARSIDPLEVAARQIGRTFSISQDLNPKNGSTLAWPIPNVWWGTSAEDQDSLDERIGDLLRCRKHAAVLWLSLEPLIGPVRIWEAVAKTIHEPPGIMPSTASIDWAVVGGESGPDARPMAPDWARSIRDECANNGRPFFMKQLDGHQKKLDQFPPDLQIREWPRNAPCGSSVGSGK